jgi:S-adenosyl-L-methionine hydrolase (adenosine-forming)
MKVITLLTDYGITDSYVAEVKGAILKINPDVTIVDVSHDVGNYDIASGAFNMARTAPYFPEGTIHVGVVDPTVGSSRKAIIVKAGTMWFVGPDNGLLAPVADRLGYEQAWEITNLKLLPHKVSDVFDGRDVFGPTGALLSKGIPADEIGTRIDEIIRLVNYQPEIDGETIHGNIIHIDGFGNVVTNITYDTLAKIEVSSETRFKLTVDEKEYTAPYVRRFSAVKEGELLCLVAGGGYLEISVNQGNAANRLGLSVGAEITLQVK